MRACVCARSARRGPLLATGLMMSTPPNVVRSQNTILVEQPHADVGGVELSDMPVFPAADSYPVAAAGTPVAVVVGSPSSASSSRQSYHTQVDDALFDFLAKAELQETERKLTGGGIFTLEAAENLSDETLLSMGFTDEGLDMLRFEQNRRRDSAVSTSSSSQAVWPKLHALSTCEEGGVLVHVRVLGWSLRASLVSPGLPTATQGQAPQEGQRQRPQRQAPELQQLGAELGERRGRGLAARRRR